MGAKNLLAIAVKGSGKIPVAKPDEFSLACKDCNKKVLATTGKEGMSMGGTTGDIPACDDAGDIPTKNWRSNSWGKGKELYDRRKRLGVERVIISQGKMYDDIPIHVQRDL